MLAALAVLLPRSWDVSLRSMYRSIILFACACACACACAGRAVPRALDDDRIAIAVAERGIGGVRLVAIDESGDRRLELVQPPAGPARDTNPAISPDGKWVVFTRASLAGSGGDARLWIAPLRPEAIAAPLTSAPGIETDPAWTRDGRAIVFASTGSAGQFDLYEQPIAGGTASGPPRRLTESPGYEVTPTVAPDGTIVYATVDVGSGGAVASHLDARAPDGAITRLTDGPLDAAPALSPDGQTIAFARFVKHGMLSDADLFVMPRAGGDARALVDLPLTDESGPVWSGDGRFVFATSLLRGAKGNVTFASVIVVDTRAPTPVARMLVDRAGAVARLTPALAPGRLDDRALAGDPEYLPELARITAKAIAVSGAGSGSASP